MGLIMLFLPLAAAAWLILIATGLHRRLPPMLAARVVAASLIVVAVAALPSMWVIGVSYLAHLPFVGVGFQWCAMAFGFHKDLPMLLALPALVLSAIGGWRAVRVLRLDRSLRIDVSGAIAYVDSHEPFAATIPGRGGQIVISTGLLALVDDRELAVVIAHEEAHAIHRHDRYLLCARLISAALPFLQPITRRLHFALERWADESAASRCADRELVAHTLAKIALHEPTPALALGFAGLGVTGRVEVLLTPVRPRIGRGIIGAIWLTTAIAGGLALLQLHHLGRLIAALCPT